jgi:hypothetical protein
MKHTPIGIAQRKTDTVARAMEILKDREISRGQSRAEMRAEQRRNFTPRLPRKP